MSQQEFVKFNSSERWMELKKYSKRRVICFSQIENDASHATKRWDYLVSNVNAVSYSVTTIDCPKSTNVPLITRMRQRKDFRLNWLKSKIIKSTKFDWVVRKRFWIMFLSSFLQGSLICIFHFIFLLLFLEMLSKISL